MNRRRFLHSLALADVAGACLPAPAAWTPAAPISIGGRKQLFVDNRFIESSRRVNLTLNPPATPAENVLLQDKPWESVRAGLPISVVEYMGAYHMWYCAIGYMGPVTAPASPRFFCYAVSQDGIHWEKPDVGCVEFQGSKANNIVTAGSNGQFFIDPFDRAERRFKCIAYHSAQHYPGWAPCGKVKGNAVYLAHSPDGRRWDLEPQAVLPFYTGVPSSTIWDDGLRKWIVYLRVNLKGHPDDPWSSHLAFARIEVEKCGLARPYPFKPNPNKKLDQFGSYGNPTDEFPVVFQTDDKDPEHQVYTLNALKYQESDLYLAFPNFWYPASSDRDDVQFAFSRDGIHWQRPFRQPVLRLGMPGSGKEGYVNASDGIIRRGDELWLYYSAMASQHLAPGGRPECLNARAIFRLDGFISADTDHEGGELTTPLLSFSGRFLELNLDTSAGGLARVEIQDDSGRPIPGYSLKEADALNGNSVRLRASWAASPDVRPLAGRPVKLRFVMRGSKLYAFQFREN